MERSTPEFKQKAALIWDAMYGQFARRELDFVIGKFKELTGGSCGAALDIGCGTGRYLIPLARQGWRVAGVDSSAEMLKVLNAKAQKERVYVPTWNADFSGLDMRQDFDLVFSFYCIIYVLEESEVLAFLAKVKESLKSGGVFIFNFFNLYDFWKGQAATSSMGRVFKTGNMKVDYKRAPADGLQAIGNIEDYRRLAYNDELIFDLTSRKIRYFSLTEIGLFMHASGFKDVKFYDSQQNKIDNKNYIHNQFCNVITVAAKA